MNAPASQDRFYFISFTVMAILCLGGFVPTFFLRPQFFDNPLPVWMNIHGAVLSLWFLIAVAQSWLILINKTAWHRQLGMAAAGIALSSFLLTYVAVAYLQATGGHITGGTHFNIILTSAFTLCVACGIYYRAKRDVHKRLMLMATVLLTIPGFDRLLRNLFQSNFAWMTPKTAQMIVMGCAVAFIGLMIYRDIRETGRPALGTMLSLGCFVVGGTLGSLFVDTNIWGAMVETFGASAVPGIGLAH
jgi:uncharacterized membrane protein YozB (DUF420 family)